MSIHRKHHRSGFTLIEVLATLMLMAIVLPAVMQGITLSSGLASASRRRTEASGLAESKLSEIVATNLWQGQTNMSGNFAPDWPDYQWTATIQPWSQDTSTQSIQEIDLTVTWLARSSSDSMTLSTLAYVKTSSSSSSSTASGS